MAEQSPLKSTQKASSVENPDKELVKALSPEQEKRDRMAVLLAQVRMTREHALRNRGRVGNSKANRHYSWVNIDQHRQIEFQSQGYVICKDPDIKTDWRKEDGTHQRGDLILYEIDKELHEALKLDDELRAYEAVAAPKHVLHTQVERAGAAVYEPQPR